MPKYSKESEAIFTERIRHLLIANNKITVREMTEQLERDPESPLKLDKDYVNKLLRKLKAERAMRLNLVTVTETLAKLEDEMNNVKAKAWEIINDPNAATRDKTSAMREIREAGKMLFDKMFDAGIFQRSLGKVTVAPGLSDEDNAIAQRAIRFAAGVAVDPAGVGTDQDKA